MEDLKKCTDCNTKLEFCDNDDFVDYWCPVCKTAYFTRPFLYTGKANNIYLSTINNSEVF